MAVASAIKYALANDLDENQIVVVLAPDSGRSYLEKIFNDDWMRANGYGDIVERTSKPSFAEQYLNGAPLMRELGTDSITSYQKNQYQHPH